MATSKRIEWIDIAKGLSIFLVVVGHTSFSGPIALWLKAFRMPFFFFVSGMLFNITKYPTYKNFISRRKNTIIRPYFIFSIIVIICNWLLCEPGRVNADARQLITGFISYPLWFIPVLILAQSLYYFLCKYLKKNWIIALELFVCSIIGYCAYIYDIHLWYKIEVVFTAVFFYGIGNLISNQVICFTEGCSKLKLYIYSLALLLSSFYISTLNRHPLDLCFNIIGDYIPAYIAAILGLLFMILISRLLCFYNNFIIYKSRNFISWMGKNSYVILAFHGMISYKFILEKIINSSVMVSLVNFCLMWTTCFIIVVLINKYAPWILGRQKVKD